MVIKARITWEETVASIRRDFIKVYQRSPKSDRELMAFVFAGALVSKENQEQLTPFITYAALLKSTFERGDNPHTKITIDVEYSIDCVRLLGDALHMLADIQLTSQLEAEVNDAMKKAMEMKPK